MYQARAVLCLAALMTLTTNASADGRADAVGKLAARIDALVEAGWKAKGVPPAPRSDDAAFLRRAWLDLAGHIPPLTEVRDFLDDESPDKRRQMVARLLRSDAYAQHTATLWAHAMMQADADQPFRDPALARWLFEQVKAGAGHDRIVRTLVASSRGAGRSLDELFPQGARPEELASAATRLFLGVKVECAQCHDHPFADWRKEQFWQQAAFFTTTGTAAIPNTNRTVKAVFLDGSVPAGGAGRAAFADWITSRANPYFARSAVNRIWARYLGTGLLDPVDEFGTSARPSHPELLDELAGAFIEGGFDERLVTEAILTSKVYQLSSVQTDAKQGDARVFARAAVRGLTPLQILENFRLVTGQAPRDDPAKSPVPERTRFQALFTGQGMPAEAETSILQALYLMNGALMSDAVNPARNRALRVLVATADSHPERCVEELYQMVLGRPPRPAELTRLAKYIREGGPNHKPGRAVADVLWALLNSSEFMLNH